MPLWKYGLPWEENTDPLKIEFVMMQKGGRYVHSRYGQVGEGLFFHYKAAQLLLWPDDYHHRWSDLILEEILQNTITGIIGPKDTGKTHVALSRYGLTDYFAFPKNTLVILSSTTLPALEARVWGDLKNLFQRAKFLHPWLPGIYLEGKRAISTDDLDDPNTVARDMRKGIICVPCKDEKGEFLSMASYVGMKQERRRHLGDEFQFMGQGMLDSISNMNSGDYKGVFTGNPIGQNDPLDKITEPEDGWDNFPEPKITTVWKNRRFLNSRTICLYGPDSPAITDNKKYPGLLSQDSINRVIAGFGKDSPQYYSQALGVRRSGLNAKRVLSMSFCRIHRIFDKVTWAGTPRTKIFALDAAYGGCGGDRCVGGHAEFGKNVEGNTVLWVAEPQMVPININLPLTPEEQISTWIKSYCEMNDIPFSNIFYDSTGRGSLGPPMARIVSVLINPVEFGGNPSNRPVTMDTYVFDEKLKARRLKLCNEHYRKFVTELWWTVRYCAEAGQLRGVTEPVADEGCMREWREVEGNKIEVETKKEMKVRTGGVSPDLFDWLVTLVEGARRRGFEIRKMANAEEDEENKQWVQELVDKARKLRNKHQLNYAA
jgi:hypothetical protein